MRRSRAIPWVRVAAAAASFLVVSPPSQAQTQTPTPTGAPAAVVLLSDNAYTPVLVKVDPAASISWRYAQTAVRPHSVTSQPSSTEAFDSSPQCTSAGLNCMTPTSSFQKRFERAGSYPYYCRVHGTPTVAPDQSKDSFNQPCGMCGLVIVGDLASPAASARTSPSPGTRTLPPGVQRTPGRAIVVAAPRLSPSASPSASPEDEIEVPTTGAPLAIPISTPRAAGRSSGAGLAAVAIGAVLIGLTSAGYLAVRRRAQDL